MVVYRLSITALMIIGSKIPKLLTTYRLRQFGLVRFAPLNKRKTGAYKINVKTADTKSVEKNSVITLIVSNLRFFILTKQAYS